MATAAQDQTTGIPIHRHNANVGQLKTTPSWPFRVSINALGQVTDNKAKPAPRPTKRQQAATLGQECGEAML